MVNKELSLFERIIMEAPEDAPPDMPAGGDSPPDVPADIPADSPPGDIGGPPPDLGGGMDTMPPDMGEDEGFGGYDDPDTQTGEGEMELDEKISAILNMNLYQRFLSLMNNIANQLSLIKGNSDVLRTLSEESLEIIGSLKKLDENIRLYLNNYFPNENYSKNLLFFNKCMNLLKLLNDIFSKDVNKGIRTMD